MRREKGGRDPIRSGNVLSLAAYLRDSGGDSQDLSTSQQLTAIQKWAEENEYVITSIFRDDARPGSTVVNRDGFQRMMSHFRDPDCQEAGLVVWKFSRISRDFDDSSFYKADLRRRGYKIFSINEDIPDGPEGRLFEAAIDWMNARFLEDLSADVRRGLYNIIKVFHCVPGPVPVGFKVIEVEVGKRRNGRPHILHRWEANPELIPLIRLAFEMRAAGATYKEIHAATHFFKYLGGYRLLLRNPIYIGRLKYGELEIDDFLPPMIDPKTWEDVQAIFEHNREALQPRYSDAKEGGRYPKDNPDHPRRRSSPFVLSGIAYCDRCGSPLVGRNVKQKNGGRWRYYHCPGISRSDDPCPIMYIPKGSLEDAVLQNLQVRLKDPVILSIIDEVIFEEISNAQLTLEQNQGKLLKDAEHVQQSLKNILAAIRMTGHSKTLLDELKRLEDEQRQIQINQARLEAQKSQLPKEIDLDPQKIQAIFEEILRNLDSAEPAEKRRILHGLIKRINLSVDKTSIVGKITYYKIPAFIPLHRATLW